MADETALVLATLRNYFTSISNTPPPLTAARSMVIGDAARVIRPAADDPPSFYTMTQTLDILEDRIRQTPGIAERFVDPEPEVWIHGDLASVFTGSEQSVADQPVRRGVHVFSLFKHPDPEAGGWKIVGVATSARKIDEALPSIVRDIGSGAGAAVMKPVRQLLDSLARRDWVGFADAFYSDSARASISRGSWPPLLLSREMLVGSLKGVVGLLPPGAKFGKEVHDVEVRVCGDWGFVWTPFDEILDGSVKRRGVNAIQCFRFGEEWKIVGFVDTSRAVEATRL